MSKDSYLFDIVNLLEAGGSNLTSLNIWYVWFAYLNLFITISEIIKFYELRFLKLYAFVNTESYMLFVDIYVSELF